MHILCVRDGAIEIFTEVFLYLNIIEFWFVIASSPYFVRRDIEITTTHQY